MQLKSEKLLIENYTYYEQLRSSKKREWSVCIGVKKYLRSERVLF